MAFSEFIINNEVIFDVNMSELRPVNGNGESINLNGPTARCLQLLIESNDESFLEKNFWNLSGKQGGLSSRKILFIKTYHCSENHC